MFYKFRIISVENKDFARELLINSKHTFLDFHHCLQSNLDYDPKQLASFFLTNAAWEKKLQITLIDMMDEESENVITMDKAKLGDHIKGDEQRMLYVFDFFTERSFFIELTEIIDLPDSKADPKIIFSHGDPPIQIDLGIGDLSFDDGNFDEDEMLESFDEEDLDDGFDFMDSEDFQDD